MTINNTGRLYQLLPEIYRIRDAEAGEPLRALLESIEEEINALENDIGGLYNNLFIETCEEWVVPYIGDLIGTRLLHAIPSADFSLRAYVANTLAYRRRKGTATVLEQLAHDTTGWPARVVEYYRLIAMTQHLNHVRIDGHALVDLRNQDNLDLIGGPFERTAHTVDVRHINNGRGRHNIPNIGLFLWRLESYPVNKGNAGKIANTGNCGFTFSPIGLDIPLFNNPRTEPEITHLAEEINLPAELRRKALSDELEMCRLPGADPNDREYFDDPPVFTIFCNDIRISSEKIYISDLSEWKVPTNPDKNLEIVVDPISGRFCFLKDPPSEPVTVSYSYGFSGGIGGGPYNHKSAIESHVLLNNTEKVWQVSQKNVAGIPGALAEWKNWNIDASDWKGIITITDSSSYRNNTDLVIDLSGRKKGTLVIQAADEQRPVLDGSIIIKGDSPDVSLVLSGLLIHGSITVESGSLDSLSLTHCTLTPGGKLNADGSPIFPDRYSLNYITIDHVQPRVMNVSIDHCITGGISLPADNTTLIIKDSIIQSFNRKKKVMIFVSQYEGDFSDEKAQSRFIFAFEKEIRKTCTPKSAFSSASVMIAKKQIIIIPAVDQIISDSEITRIQEDLMHLADSFSNFFTLSSGFFMTYATIGRFFEDSVADSSQHMEMNVIVMNGSETNPNVITSCKIGIDIVPESSLCDRLQKAIENAGNTDDTFSDVTVCSFKGSILAFHQVNRVDKKPYEIVFDATDNDHTSVYQLGLSGDSSIAISDDCIHAGPASVLERATIFGEVRVKELNASGVIFNDIVVVEKNQEGCVRFCYVPPDSITPKRYRCQPEFALMREKAHYDRNGLVFSTEEKTAIQVSLVPQFTSVHYRNPGYCQLGRRCAKEICAGGEDGSEIGAFSFLMQPQREANLRVALDEYLSFGLEAGIIYIT